MSKTTALSEENTVHKCDSIVGQTDQAGFEKLKCASQKFADIAVRHISEATYIKHINCHSQRDAKSPRLGIPADQHVLPVDCVAYMISWAGDKPGELADFWQEVESMSS